MDWMTFASSLVGSLAWPVAAVVLLLLIRRPLLALLPLARKVKFKDLELEFGEKVRELSSAADVLPEARTDAAAALPQAHLRRLARLMPAATVLEAWREVEAAAVGALARGGIELDLDVAEPYKRLQETLVERGLLPVKQARVFGELRRLRNKVAHAPDFDLSPPQAVEYVDLALRMRGALEDVGAPAELARR